MKRTTNNQSFLLRVAMTLVVVLLTSATAWAQYVFVIPNGGQVRAALSMEELESCDWSNDMIMLWEGVTSGTTVYFDFRPLTDYHFKEVKFVENNQPVDVSFSVDDNGVYSFTIPDGVTFLNVQVNFEETYVPPTGVNINEANFPDAKFRKWLLAQSYGKDKVITDEEMATITKIVAQGCGIEDLTGIQFFTKLIELDVSNLPSKHAVENWNRIASIDLSGNTKLQKLSIDNNLLTTINLAPCPDLTNLQISFNRLTALDVSTNVFLSILYCEDNQIAALDLSNNPDLSILGCLKNQLTALDVSNNTNLNQLYCEYNQIATLDVSNHNKLIILNCNDNQLTSLDVSGCTELFQLYCYNNKIKGEAMTNLVNSLATPPRGGYMVVIDLESDIEENEMTDEQVAAAKAKRWSVEACLDDGFVSYPYDPNVHQFVDLGLSSGTLWATTNIGATHSYQSGLFFAWGDTQGHGSDVSDGYLFNWENYKWGEVIDDNTWFTKYCSDSSRGLDGFTDGKFELAPEDDAAYVNWGPQWRMPTKEQFDELRNECTWTRMYLGDVYGYDVEGPNGNSIFLPDTQWRIDDMLLDGGAFWTRTANPEDVGGAYYLGWNAYEWEHYDWYEYGGRCDGQCVRPVINKTIELANDADNREVIEAAASSNIAYDVKLSGRTFYKDGTWNTLCLPFALDADQIETMLDSPEQIKTLFSTDFEPATGTLTLNFVETTTIDAGKPYIIKWAKADDYADDNEHNLYEPTFTNVMVSNATEAVESDFASFIGTTSPVTLTANDRTVLYLSANNTLYWPSEDMTVTSCHAYFELKGGITAGDKVNEVRSFRLNFGDGETTAIERPAISSYTEGQNSDSWYSIDGRRLSGKPKAKGLYINNGHKLFIK